MTHFVTGLKLLHFDSLVDPITEFREPFTPALGLFIAPLKTLHYEDTDTSTSASPKMTGLSFVVLLTTAYVARSPPVYPNTDMSLKHTSQPREDIVAPGNYRNAMGIP